MGKSLVIVESPAKAKTINRYLGKEYIVKSSIGHVRDLPVSGSSRKGAPKKAKESLAGLSAEEKSRRRKEKSHKALIDRMGIDPDKDWKAFYQILPGKEKVIQELKQCANQADKIYLATDLDREGEAIAWHLQEVIGGNPERYHRVVFNEITKKAVTEAFSHPSVINMSRVNAQQARRFLDRVVGYMVSPLLWAKIARGLSAGRVQSVAVRLATEREREIRAFIPEEFWEVYASLTTQKLEPIELQVIKQNGQNFRPTNEEQAKASVAALEKLTYTAVKREDKPTQSKPSPPFITSTLQQSASTRLGFGVKKTMLLAQKLYEAGFITYMRTDATTLSQDAVTTCREYIEKNFGSAYVPEQSNQYGNQEGAQEAHEAIRPTEVTRLVDSLTNMDRDAKRLYELIWRRFVACQMPPANFLSSTLQVEAGEYLLKAKGRILKFDGHLRVQPHQGKKGDEEVILPAVAVGDQFNLKGITPKQHFTKPPPRFTEAGLVRELEKRRIGRPSTYASIISTIQDRGYVHLENKRFYAEKMGEIVTDRLVESFKELMDYNFTAQMETQLDSISTGKMDWKNVLNEFYKEFVGQLKQAEQPEGMRANIPVLLEDLPCSSCGRQMQVRMASTGVFLGCSGYALPPKERCKKTINLLPGDDVIAADTDEELIETDQLRSKRRCVKCDAAMDAYLIDESKRLHLCGNAPDCDGYIIEQGQFKIKGYDGPIIECDKCSAEMQLKNGRFGKFFACSNENCKNTRKLLKSGEVAPPRADPIPMPDLKCVKSDDYYLLRDGAAGIFLAASQFPKNRETRAPFVSEVQTVKDQLDPKLKYLAAAPAEDPEGNPAVIRYSRKSKSQYIMSEKDNKATGWRLEYQDGRWVEVSGIKKNVVKEA